MSTMRYYITFPTLKETWIDNTHHPTLLEQGIEKWTWFHIEFKNPHGSLNVISLSNNPIRPLNVIDLPKFHHYDSLKINTLCMYFYKAW